MTVPCGVVTIRNCLHNETMFSADANLDKDRRHVGTWKGNGPPPCPAKASRWNIIPFGQCFFIQNVLTEEFMYANDPMRDKERRWVLTHSQDGSNLTEKPHFHWVIVPVGMSFGIKNLAHGEWAYANDPTVPHADTHRAVLTWKSEAKHSKEACQRWLIEAIISNVEDFHPAFSFLSQGLAQRAQIAAVESCGFDNGNAASFFLNDICIPFVVSRGLNVVILDPATFDVSSKTCYDIHADVDQNVKLASDLNALPLGSIVLAAIKDSGLENLNIASVSALHGVGGTISTGEFRQGYALIGRKGGCAVAEERGHCVKIRGAINNYSVAKTSTLKVKHCEYFYRIKLTGPLHFREVEHAVANAIGHGLSGMKLVYVDEDGDPCVLNAATFTDWHRPESILNVELKRSEKDTEVQDDGGNMVPQAASVSQSSNVSCGSFDVVEHTPGS
eukprot:TRINITY_DN12428_c1_g2_i1.p1 TRINITY_DN12428_c1_g2~~TRINITY_DN12428_c1_g2_i1.p1  ORF type:complete len:445 (-),score=40.00 TRINITY_DN12428_c1_g2_i1:101-1435(-)